MITTTATFEGNLAGDPEIKFSTTGKPRAELVVLVSERRQDEGGVGRRGTDQAPRDSHRLPRREPR